MPAWRLTKEFDGKAFSDLIGLGCGQDRAAGGVNYGKAAKRNQPKAI